MLNDTAELVREPTGTEWLFGFGVLLLAAFATVMLIKSVARLMGLHVGLLRVTIATVVGITVGGLTLGKTVASQDMSESSFAIYMGVTFLSILLTLAIMEALKSNGIGWIGRVRSARGRIRRGRRYTEITKILVRYGLDGYLRGRRRSRDSSIELARSLRLALEQAGVTFVKFGQVLSTRRDLFGPEVITELSKLCDDVAPCSWEEIVPQLREDLGRPVEEAFAWFDHEPIASASIAQVYRAGLHTGEEVAVKVRRPGCEQQVAHDLEILEQLSTMFDNRVAWARRIGVKDLIQGFSIALREELDFRVEARNLAAVNAAREVEETDDTDVDEVEFPRAYHEFSAERLLVMQYLDGVAISDVSVADRPGLDHDRLARSLLVCLLRQILIDGIFHADPHPGNILLLDDDRPALIDYGSVGRIDAALQSSLQQVLLAIDQRDPAALHDGLTSIIERTDDVDTDGLERALGRFMARHLSAGLAPDAQMFTDLFRMVSAHGVALPREIAAVFRALATLEGTLTALAPTFHIVDETRAFAAGRFSSLMEPGSLLDTANDELRAMLPTLRRIPRRLERITAALEHGRLSMNVRLLADPRDRKALHRYHSQGLLTILSATTGVMAVMLLDSEAGPLVSQQIRLYQVFGYVLLVASMMLMVRVLVGLFRKPD